MQKNDFKFDLPDHLIANEPSSERCKSRLLLVDPRRQTLNDRLFYQLIEQVHPNDCLIFNNTKVIPARLEGFRESGGRVEVLLERIIPDETTGRCLAQLRASNSPKPGSKIVIADDFVLEVSGREGNFFKLDNISALPLFELVEKYGSMPLPPYIQRKAQASDKETYQTVYAEQLGAVAAPTAGLHFDHAMLQALKDKGVAMDFVTLHVGAGTFSPVRVDNILDHKMHSEWFQVPQSVVDQVKQTRIKGGRVIAVGTTSVRCLESASVTGELKASCGETDIFIYPGYQFKSVDALVTNFHLSESTLLMLVSAFAGREFILSAYEHAIASQYRFFSYGDAMLIENAISPAMVSTVHNQ